MTEKRRTIIYIVLILIIVAAFFISAMPNGFKGEYAKYKCDVKSLNLATTIEISKGDTKIAKVKGDLLRFVTDPLTMYDTQNNSIAYAGDAYHFIAQDSHSIYVNDVFTAEMVGLVDIWGESYDIYDIEQNKIANVTLNGFNTKGKMKDTEGNVIADFYSNAFFNDFEVRIANDCPIDHNTVLMIFASYYSDQAADK